MRRIRKKFATIISADAPTMTNTDETKDKFYEDFGYVISAIPAANKLIILVNVNVRVWQNRASYWVNTEPENATKTPNCFYRHTPNIIL